MNSTVKYPEDLLKIVCETCLESLHWVADKESGFLCDATATADCCGRLYNAYAAGINISSSKDGE